MLVITGLTLGGAAGGGAGSGLCLKKAHTYSPNLEASCSSNILFKNSITER